MRMIAASFAGLLLALCTAAAPATRPALVTLRLKDVKPQAVLDEFNRQSRLQLTVSDTESLPAKVSIEVDALPPLLALREVCAALHVAPGVSGDPDTLTLEPDDTFLKKPFAAAGPVMVVVDFIAHSKSVHASGVEPTSTFEMQLTALIDPALRVLAHHPGIRITEAVDDRGNSLVLRKPPAEQAAEVDDIEVDSAAASVIHIDLTAALAYPPKDVGKRIARLKGSVVAHVLHRSDRWELADPMKAREQTRSAAGVRYVINRVAKKQESYQVELTLHQETAGDEQWHRLENLALPATLRLLDEKGKPLAFEGPEDEAIGARVRRYTLTYAAQDPVTERPAGPPAKLVWELPVEIKTVELPFELRDVPMP